MANQDLRYVAAKVVLDLATIILTFAMFRALSITLDLATKGGT